MLMPFSSLFVYCLSSRKTPNFLLQYAERLPIGLEKVIRTVSADTVKQFFRKWYHLHNMAVIAVGDFSDTQVGLCNLYMFLYTTMYTCGQIFLTLPSLSLSGRM